MRFEISTISTPIGNLVFAVHDETLYALDFGQPNLVERLAKRFDRPGFVERNGALRGTRRGEGGKVARAVAAYLEGDIDALDALAVEPGGTPFQRRVWDALRTIPSGTTASYQSIAVAVGSPGAVRAVGTANGANPIAVVIPCHRVIRSDQTLGGYGGGLDRKRWLLAHELESKTVDVSVLTAREPDKNIRMQRALNFNAGPATLPLPALERAQRELLDFAGTGMSVMEHSHRGKEYEAVHNEAIALVKELYAVPDSHDVLFLQGGASQEFATVPMNLLPQGKSADYVLTGAWGEKALSEAKVVAAMLGAKVRVAADSGKGEGDGTSQAPPGRGPH